MGQKRHFRLGPAMFAITPIATAIATCRSIALSHKRQSAAQQACASFDHLVGASGQVGRHFDMQHFGDLEVDHELKLDRRDYR